MKTSDFDRRFDESESFADELDPAKFDGLAQEQQRVNADSPLYGRTSREAWSLGVTCQSVIKVWIFERLDRGG